jgi:hypothetical protein
MIHTCHSLLMNQNRTQKSFNLLSLKKIKKLYNYHISLFAYYHISLFAYYHISLLAFSPSPLAQLAH